MSSWLMQMALWARRYVFLPSSGGYMWKIAIQRFKTIHNEAIQ